MTNETSNQDLGKAQSVETAAIAETVEVAEATEPKKTKKAPPERVDKREIIRQAAKISGLDVENVTDVYEALIHVIFNNVRAGKKVAFTGFGVFSSQSYKGRRANYGGKEIPEFTILKFKGSRMTKNYMSMSDEEAKKVRVPGTRVVVSGRLEKRRTNAPFLEQEFYLDKRYADPTVKHSTYLLAIHARQEERAKRKEQERLEFEAKRKLIAEQAKQKSQQSGQ